MKKRMLKISEILEATNGKLLKGDNNIEIDGIATDSRVSCKNRIFIPLIGENFDGHNFVTDAYNKGAIATLTEKEDIAIPKNLTVIKVKDTLEALGNLAKYWIKKNNFKIIGITGSAGKTTTKELLKSVTNFKGTEKNFNNLIGVPLTVLNATSEEKYLILELGTNKIGEMEKLTEITLPEYVIITNIGYGHIQGFGSVENVFKEKFSIITKNRNLIKAIVNCDNEIVLKSEEYKNNKNIIITTGLSNNLDVKLLKSISHITKGNYIEFSYFNKKYSLTSKLLGKHNALNILSVFAIAKELGFKDKDIINKIERFSPVDNRSEVIKTSKGITIINDSYNANFNSFAEAINLFDELNINGNKSLIIGDMFELGTMSKTLHKKLGETISNKNFKYIIGIGKEIKTTLDSINGKGKEVKYFKRKNDAKDFILKNIKKNDSVLIKASRGMKFEEIVNWLVNTCEG